MDIRGRGEDRRIFDGSFKVEKRGKFGGGWFG